MVVVLATGMVMVMPVFQEKGADDVHGQTDSSNQHRLVIENGARAEDSLAAFPRHPEREEAQHRPPVKPPRAFTLPVPNVNCGFKACFRAYR